MVYYLDIKILIFEYHFQKFQKYSAVMSVHSDSFVFEQNPVDFENKIDAVFNKQMDHLVTIREDETPCRTMTSPLLIQTSSPSSSDVQPTNLKNSLNLRLSSVDSVSLRVDPELRTPCIPSPVQSEVFLPPNCEIELAPYFPLTNGMDNRMAYTSPVIISHSEEQLDKTSMSLPTDINKSTNSLSQSSRWFCRICHEG